MLLRRRRQGLAGTLRILAAPSSMAMCASCPHACMTPGFCVGGGGEGGRGGTQDESVFDVPDSTAHHHHSHEQAPRATHTWLLYSTSLSSRMGSASMSARRATVGPEPVPMVPTIPSPAKGYLQARENRRVAWRENWHGLQPICLGRCVPCPNNPSALRSRYEKKLITMVTPVRG